MTEDHLERLISTLEAQGEVQSLQPEVLELKKRFQRRLELGNFLIPGARAHLMTEGTFLTGQHLSLETLLKQCLNDLERMDFFQQLPVHAKGNQERTLFMSSRMELYRAIREIVCANFERFAIGKETNLLRERDVFDRLNTFFMQLMKLYANVYTTTHKPLSKVGYDAPAALVEGVVVYFYTWCYLQALRLWDQERADSLRRMVVEKATVNRDFIMRWLDTAAITVGIFEDIRGKLLEHIVPQEYKDEEDLLRLELGAMGKNTILPLQEVHQERASLLYSEERELADKLINNLQHLQLTEMEEYFEHTMLHWNDGVLRLRYTGMIDMFRHMVGAHTPEESQASARHRHMPRLSLHFERAGEPKASFYIEFVLLNQSHQLIPHRVEENGVEQVIGGSIDLLSGMLGAPSSLSLLHTLNDIVQEICDQPEMYKNYAYQAEEFIAMPQEERIEKLLEGLLESRQEMTPEEPNPETKEEVPEETQVLGNLYYVGRRLVRRTEKGDVPVFIPHSTVKFQTAQALLESKLFQAVLVRSTGSHMHYRRSIPKNLVEEGATGVVQAKGHLVRHQNDASCVENNIDRLWISFDAFYLANANSKAVTWEELAAMQAHEDRRRLREFGVRKGMTGQR